MWLFLNNCPTSFPTGKDSYLSHQARHSQNGAADRRPVLLYPERPQLCELVIDTSVLLSDPRALLRFAEHEVIVPIVVITRTGRKTPRPRTGILRPQGPEAPGRPQGRARRTGPPIPLGRRRRDPQGGDEPHLPRGAARRIPGRRQRQPHPRRREEPRQRRPERHGGLQGPADARQGLRHGAAQRTSTATNWSRTPAGPGWPKSRPARRKSPPSTATNPSSSPPLRNCPSTPGWCCSPTAVPPWAG